MSRSNAPFSSTFRPGVHNITGDSQSNPDREGNRARRTSRPGGNITGDFVTSQVTEENRAMAFGGAREPRNRNSSINVRSGVTPEVCVNPELSVPGDNILPVLESSICASAQTTNESTDSAIVISASALASSDASSEEDERHCQVTELGKRRKRGGAKSKEARNRKKEAAAKGEEQSNPSVPAAEGEEQSNPSVPAFRNASPPHARMPSQPSQSTVSFSQGMEICMCCALMAHEVKGACGNCIYDHILSKADSARSGKDVSLSSEGSKPSLKRLREFADKPGMTRVDFCDAYGFRGDFEGVELEIDPSLHQQFGKVLIARNDVFGVDRLLVPGEASDEWFLIRSLDNKTIEAEGLDTNLVGSGRIRMDTIIELPQMRALFALVSRRGVTHQFCSLLCSIDQLHGLSLTPADIVNCSHAGCIYQRCASAFATLTCVRSVDNFFTDSRFVLMEALRLQLALERQRRYNQERIDAAAKAGAKLVSSFVDDVDIPAYFTALLEKVVEVASQMPTLNRFTRVFLPDIEVFIRGKLGQRATSVQLRDLIAVVLNDMELCIALATGLKPLQRQLIIRSHPDKNFSTPISVSVSRELIQLWNEITVFLVGDGGGPKSLDEMMKMRKSIVVAANTIGLTRRLIDYAVQQKTELASAPYIAAVKSTSESSNLPWEESSQPSVSTALTTWEQMTDLMAYDTRVALENLNQVAPRIAGELQNSLVSLAGVGQVDKAIECAVLVSVSSGNEPKGRSETHAVVSLTRRENPEAYAILNPAPGEVVLRTPENVEAALLLSQVETGLIAYQNEHSMDCAETELNALTNAPEAFVKAAQGFNVKQLCKEHTREQMRSSLRAFGGWLFTPCRTELEEKIRLGMIKSTLAVLNKWAHGYDLNKLADTYLDGSIIGREAREVMCKALEQCDFEASSLYTLVKECEEEFGSYKEVAEIVAQLQKKQREELEKRKKLEAEREALLVEAMSDLNAQLPTVEQHKSDLFNSVSTSYRVARRLFDEILLDTTPRYPDFHVFSVELIPAQVGYVRMFASRSKGDVESSLVSTGPSRAVGGSGSAPTSGYGDVIGKAKSVYRGGRGREFSELENHSLFKFNTCFVPFVEDDLDTEDMDHITLYGEEILCKLEKGTSRKSESRSTFTNLVNVPIRDFLGHMRKRRVAGERFLPFIAILNNGKIDRILTGSPAESQLHKRLCKASGVDVVKVPSPYEITQRPVRTVRACCNDDSDVEVEVEVVVKSEKYTDEEVDAAMQELEKVPDDSEDEIEVVAKEQPVPKKRFYGKDRPKQPKKERKPRG